MKTTEKTNWKNRLLAACAVCALLAAALLSVNVFAAGSYQDKDLPLGSSSEVLMVGEIEPTLMSVTVPSYVPFHISRSVEGENKVISPRVTITSHSAVPEDSSFTVTPTFVIRKA